MSHPVHVVRRLSGWVLSAPVSPLVSVLISGLVSVLVTVLISGLVAAFVSLLVSAPSAERLTLGLQADAGQDRPSAARIALTFDDLPAHGPLPPGLTRVDIATRIIAALRQHGAPPVYGFINAKALDDRPEDAQVLRLWREAGFPLGNHAYSHMDLHANPVEAFEQDILANQPALRTYMGDRDWHWFRFPYLREGDTAEKRRAVRSLLQRHGYKVAQVTVSFDDYAYNDPYARCLARSDAAAIDWLKESFLTRASESLARGQEASRALYGRDIAHVMLLHIGGFQTVMLPRLLDLLTTRGFTLTTMEEAARDPAYAIDPDLSGSTSGTLLNQMYAARGLAVPRRTDGLFEKLAALCR